MLTKISSNYFFNFTSNLDYLVETLQHSAFSPRYNCEDFSYLQSSFGVTKQIYILMKCFCDIPLSPLMKNHINEYGSYGIGLTKEWGMKNNLTPVHYIPVLSADVWYQRNLASLYSFAFSTASGANMRDMLTNYFIYTKPYKRDGTIFYDEREWRYVPSSEDLRIRHHVILPNQDITNFGALNDESNKLKNNEYVKLPFNLTDIEYLIVQNKIEVDQIERIIKGNGSITILRVDDILINDNLEA